MTAVNPEPRGPGEIGWPANADHPHDPSVPAPGSGGAKAEDLPELSPPTITDEAPVDEPVEAVVVDEPAPVEVEVPVEATPEQPQEEQPPVDA